MYYQVGAGAKLESSIGSKVEPDLSKAGSSTLFKILEICKIIFKYDTITISKCLVLQ